MTFKKRIYGKWILSGEHSVLRSQPALVFPFTHYYVDFSFKQTQEALTIRHSGQDQAGLDFSFLPLFDEALSMVGQSRKNLQGEMVIDSKIPFGAGLGASAILSSACALFFEHQSWIPKEACFSFAKKLENLFHKTSSGVDVAGVLEGKALLFQNGKIQKYLEPSRIKPSLYLSYSGRRSSTFLSISKVKDFFKDKSDLLQKIDQDMARSVELCMAALVSKEKELMLEKLTQGLLVGEKCFEDLGMLSYDLKKHSQILKQAGALATKPTGSGLGGYIISLWPKEAPKDIGVDFKPISI